MDQLIKRMLAIGYRLAPVDEAGITRDFASIKCDVFAVALHGQLLEVGWESLQVLLVGKDCYSGCTEEVVIPNSQQPHENGQVALERSRTEMLVHLMKAFQHRAK